jgi:L-iditol 2-dehydrogenase
MCRYCLAGHESVCDLLAATNFDPGGFCEYVRVPAVNVRNGLYKLPDNMSYEQAVFIEPLACVYRGHSHAGFMLGKTVLVIGSGIAGLLHIHLARVSGAVRIIAADVRQSRLDAALVFGADTVVFSDEKLSETVKAANSGRPVDVVITAAGAKSALEQAFRCVDKGGTILFFAPSDPGLTLEMPFNELWRKEITMTSTYAGSPRDIHAAIELIAAGRMKVQDMITHRLPLSRTQEGFSLVAAADDCMKVVVLPQE